MRYLKQFTIIIVISLVGELLNYILPFMIPASIYGLAIMLVCLMLGVIKVEHIKETSDFLLDIMPIMFVPAAVGLMDSWGVLRQILAPALIVSVGGTILVMIITAVITQKIANAQAKDEAASDLEKGGAE